MYGRGVAGNRERIMASIAELRDDIAKLCQRARAGIDVLVSHPQVDGRVAAVGYCFGGMVVLELARSGADIAGAVSVHGSLTTSRPARAGTVKAKLLVCHGALGPHVPMTKVNAFVQEMNEAGADWQLAVYGGAMHGFTHETGPRGARRRIPCRGRRPLCHRHAKFLQRTIRLKHPPDFKLMTHCSAP